LTACRPTRQCSQRDRPSGHESVEVIGPDGNIAVDDNNEGMMSIALDSDKMDEPMSFPEERD